ncbi:hypothetical protein N780_01885 [Pontibacillus chungwhensis BH030062]|uniref:ParB/Sulfiredoxin domain-containing protein n=1 Tax=Pontibacillus chungwhensis BH030062 TaxID=1385513 RepID=A0A0A2VFL3_9BACI|nr:hypothetical protein [Pontibacillus chungwhensis]KGP92395.1 hypothetical protein N780_01885 [Pontibacillus chungwhensis BH030062]
MDFSTWETRKLPLDKIFLDPDNPRVFVDNPTQKKLRNYLVEYFDIIDLARSIDENRDLYPTEKIVVVIEDGKYIVVEGNRRIAACQVLKKPEILKENHSYQLSPQTTTQMNVSNIEVVIAPSRDEAEPFITSKHTERSVKSWSRLSQVRRVLVRYNRGQSISSIAAILNTSEYQISRSLKFHSFMQYAWDEIEWNEKEKDIIVNPLIKATKLDRFLPFSDKAKELLEIRFENYQFKYAAPKEFVDMILKDIFRQIFVYETINTRTQLDQVFTDTMFKKKEEHLEGKEDSIPVNQETTVTQSNAQTKKSVSTNNIDEIEDKEHDKSQTTQNKKEKDVKFPATKRNELRGENSNSVKPPKPVERKHLYKGIIYQGSSSGISRALYELEQINYKKHTLSATFLVRTLIECSLQVYLRSIGRENEVMNKGKDPSLTGLLKFYDQENILRGTHNRLQGIIENFSSQNWADTLNSISHAKYSEPDPNLLKLIESQTFNLIKWLLEQSEVKN